MAEFPDDTHASHDDMMALYMAIGQLVYAWGLIESCLTLTIDVIYHDIGGRQEVDEILPFVLKDKIAFVRKCLMGIKPLKPYRKRWWPILEEIARHNKLRIGIVHGSNTGYDPATGQFRFTKLDGGGTAHTSSNVIGTVLELAVAGRAMIELVAHLSNAMSALADDFGRPRQNPVNNPLGHISV